MKVKAILNSGYFANTRHATNYIAYIDRQSPIFDQNGTEKKVLSAQVEVEAPGKAVSFMGYLQGEQKYNFEFNPKENFSSFRHLLEKLKSNLERKIVLSLFCAPMG